MIIRVKYTELATEKLLITFLGTGTSQGVPVIGCDCEVCLSTDPRDKRLRTSVLVSAGGTNVVIDCGPDFRQQMLRAGVQHLEALVLTHEHNDHIIGLDDVRPFNFKQQTDMPVFARPRVIDELEKRFAYVFAAEPYPGAPRLALHPISDDPCFRIGALEFRPVEVMHGHMPVLGFRIGNFAYITDMKTIGEEEKKKLKGVTILVVNALHHSEHNTHLNLKEALAFIEEIRPQRALLTHMSHRMGLHDVVNKTLLPQNVELAYDGLIVEVV